MTAFRPVRILIGAISIAGLIAVFLFQRVDVAGYFSLGAKSIDRFLINRTVRFLSNDLFAIGLIYAFFGQRKYAVFSLWIQLSGVILLLLPYFILKIYFPVYNGPLISYLHRLIMNPILIYLLIFFFWYQEKQSDTGMKDISK